MTSLSSLRRSGRVSVLLLLLSLVLGCRSAEVVRVVDGVEAPGRFISDRAYAAFLVGAEWEARARYEDALSAYLQAAQSDPENVEVFSRMGWLLCMLDHPDEAREAFDAALERDPRYEPTWRRQARCAERQGRLQDAIEASSRAVAMDPSRDETVLLHARLLTAADRSDEAWPWLRELALRSPGSEEVWEVIADHAAQRRPAWAAEALRRLAAMKRRRGPRPTEPSGGGWYDVEAALVAGDLDEARRRARSAHLDARLVGARAILAGRPTLALEEAKLRFDADPSDLRARVVVALAADLTGDRALAAEAIAGIAQERDRLDRVGRALFAELLLRHAGTDAAALWLGEDPKQMTVPALRQRARDAFAADGSTGADR